MDFVRQKKNGKILLLNSWQQQAKLKGQRANIDYNHVAVANYFRAINEIHPITSRQAAAIAIETANILFRTSNTDETSEVETP